MTKAEKLLTADGTPLHIIRTAYRGHCFTASCVGWIGVTLSAADNRETFYVDGLVNIIRNIAWTGERYEIELRANSPEREQRLRALIDQARKRMARHHWGLWLHRRGGKKIRRRPRRNSSLVRL